MRSLRIWMTVASAALLTFACAGSTETSGDEDDSSGETGGGASGGSDGGAATSAGGSTGGSSAGGSSAGGSSTGGSSTGGAGVGGSGGAMCDPTDSGCVTCMPTSCAAPEVCCGNSSTVSCQTTCSDVVHIACDGAEDCPNGDCCVDADVDTQGIQNLLAQCGTTCPISSQVSGTSGSLESVACRTPSDCAGVTDDNNVPFDQCCTLGTSVGACADSTTASYVEALGGNCE